MNKVELVVVVENRANALTKDIYFDKPSNKVTEEEVRAEVRKIMTEGIIDESGTWVNVYFSPSTIKEIRWTRRDA